MGCLYMILCSAHGPSLRSKDDRCRTRRLVGRVRRRTRDVLRTYKTCFPWVSTPPLWTHQIHGSPASKIRKATSKYGELALACSVKCFQIAMIPIAPPLIPPHPSCSVPNVYGAVGLLRRAPASEGLTVKRKLPTHSPHCRHESC